MLCLILCGKLGLLSGTYINSVLMIFVIYRLLTETYSKCNESGKNCLVLDKAGFLVMHDDFLSPDITAKGVEYVHITEKENDMAEDLIHRGYLVRKQCRNLEQLKLETFYEIQLPRRGVNTLHTGLRCKKYQLSQVNGSNVFLGRLPSFTFTKF